MIAPEIEELYCTRAAVIIFVLIPNAIQYAAALYFSRCHRRNHKFFLVATRFGSKVTF